MDVQSPFRPTQFRSAGAGLISSHPDAISSQNRFNELSVFTDAKQTPRPPLKPVRLSSQVTQSPIKSDYYSELAQKKLQLEQLKREMETVEFEILELESKISHSENVIAPSRQSLDSLLGSGKALSRKVSKLFLAGSTILTPASSQRTLVSPKKIEDPFNSLQRKALNYFNNRLLPDMKEKLEEQQTELEIISKKGADLAKNIISSFSPKKKEPSLVGDTSYSLDHLGDLSLINTSIILSDDSVVDIDDYESD